MMKRLLYGFVAAGVLFAVSACEDTLEEEVRFSVSATSPGAEMDGDVLVVKKSQAVTFHFSGEPDFITFYSGEAGAEYRYVNRTTLDKDDLESKFVFDIQPFYGVIPGTLKIYLAKDFEGLQKDGYLNDITRVNDYQGWEDITGDCALPTTSVRTRVEYDIDPEYLEQPVRIAFEYKTEQNTQTQPRWDIYDLRVVNTIKKDGSQATLLAESFGFSVLNIYSSSEEDAYKTGSSPGYWNLANIANSSDPKIVMSSSAAGSVMNHDWLISSPIDLASCDPDSGTAIKNISQKLPSYSHVYNLEGEYTVTFLASNSRMNYYSGVTREVKIRVEE